jgi:nucleoid-associated protein YgaU
MSVCAAMSVTGLFLLTIPSYGQDLADAARQERTHKEAQRKRSSHVYDETDLRRPHILTPEDRARVEAKQRPIDPSNSTPERIDAQEVTPETPQRDVARQPRGEQRVPSGNFHLPFKSPALASPIAPLRRGIRSPFSKPPVAHSAPSDLKRPAMHRTATAFAVTIQPGDSLWKLAETHLGNGYKWQDLLATNPWIADPNHIEAGTQISLPSTGESRRSGSKVTVRVGDTLSQIALSIFGHAGSWRCIAQANPQVRNADRIYAGQELTLPSSCRP